MGIPKTVNKAICHLTDKEWKEKGASNWYNLILEHQDEGWPASEGGFPSDFLSVMSLHLWFTPVG